MYGIKWGIRVEMLGKRKEKCGEAGFGLPVYLDFCFATFYLYVLVLGSQPWNE